MALTYSVLSSLVIFMLLFTTLVLAQPQPESDAEDTPFEFIKQFEGGHLGETNVTDLHKLKTYLQTFGYAPSNTNSSDSDDDDFDDSLESAIKTYQTNYNLEPTGTLDNETVAQMVMPRCGVPDNDVDGTTRMASGNSGSSQSQHPSPFHLISHFRFFPGNPRWPLNRTVLRYTFQPGTPLRFLAPIQRAFTRWDAATRFTFVQVHPTGRPDINVSFGRREHGDGFPFDGRWGVLAHAFRSMDGRVHFDSDEIWATGPRRGNCFVDLETVALHEIGHLIGFDHSSVRNAIMWPSYTRGAVRGLHTDDIQGIQALYRS